MKREYKNKTIAVIGDSVTQHGKHFYYMRSYFQHGKEKCYLYNRGTGGNRAVMFPYLFEEEIKELDADYVMISYAVNDMGVWLYDYIKPVTAELLEKRRARDEEYFASYKKAIEIVKEYGAIPIVLSPFAVDEFIIEKEGVETLADNDEKEDNLKPSFYTRATFRNLNQALKGYAERLKALAVETGAQYFPVFEKTYFQMRKQTGMFKEDGIHYNFQTGYKFLTKIFLEYLGCEDIPQNFADTAENQEIERLEQLERQAGFIKRATPYNRYFGEFSEEEMLKNAKKIATETGGWYADCAKLYLQYYQELPALRKKIRKLTEEL